MLERQLYSINCKQLPGAMRVSHEDCLIFCVLSVCLFPTPSVWRRKPSTHRPPLAAMLSRSLWGTHTSWFGTSEDRRAFEPAGTHTTAAPRYGSLNVFDTWQINIYRLFADSYLSACICTFQSWFSWFSWKFLVLCFQYLLLTIVVLCSNVKRETEMVLKVHGYVHINPNLLPAPCFELLFLPDWSLMTRALTAGFSICCGSFRLSFWLWIALTVNASL